MSDKTPIEKLDECPDCKRTLDALAQPALRAENERLRAIEIAARAVVNYGVGTDGHRLAALKTALGQT
jgi:hypothetical protein